MKINEWYPPDAEVDRANYKAYRKMCFDYDLPLDTIAFTDAEKKNIADDSFCLQIGKGRVEHYCKRNDYEMHSWKVLGCIELPKEKIYIAFEAMIKETKKEGK